MESETISVNLPGVHCFPYTAKQFCLSAPFTSSISIHSVKYLKYLGDPQKKEALFKSWKYLQIHEFFPGHSSAGTIYLQVLTSPAWVPMVRYAQPWTTASSSGPWLNLWCHMWLQIVISIFFCHDTCPYHTSGVPAELCHRCASWRDFSWTFELLPFFLKHNISTFTFRLSVTK